MKQALIQILIMATSLVLLSCGHTSHERTMSSSNANQVERLWLSAGQSEDSVVRSNVAHFWAWMSRRASSELGDVLNHRGAVAADPHFFNFGDIHEMNGQAGLALIDIDDSGQAPLLLDFIRYSLFLKYYLKGKAPLENFGPLQSELYQNYLAGLSRTKMLAPPVLQNVIQKSRKKLEKEHAEWVFENLDDFANQDFGLRRKALDLKDLSKIKAIDAEAGRQLEKILQAQPSISKIYDIAHTTHKSGSSAGLNRFWFSILTTNQTHRILECKQLSKPAVEFYEPQSMHEQRIEQVLKFYSDFRTNDNFVVTATPQTYWCRPREFQLLKKGHIEKLSLQETKVLALYFAHWLGTKQALQPAGAPLLSQLRNETSQGAKISKLQSDYELELSK